MSLIDLEQQREQIVETPEFQACRIIPSACQGCPCRGGCAGRRALLGSLDLPDPFCPFARGERISIAWERADSEDLPKAGSACTTIVSAR